MLFSLARLRFTQSGGLHTVKTSFDNGDLQALLFELIHDVSFVAGSAPLLNGADLLRVDALASVPEPSTFGLFGTGLAMLLFVARWHFKQRCCRS